MLVHYESQKRFRRSLVVFFCSVLMPAWIYVVLCMAVCFCLNELIEEKIIVGNEKKASDVRVCGLNGVGLGSAFAFCLSYCTI